MNRMTKYITAFEATNNLVKCITLGHGENADLVTSISSCGIPVCLEGYTVEAIFQPESAWGTETYYEVPSEIVGDVAIVHWSHLQDNGDNRVKIWVNFSKDGEVSYPAMYQLSLFVTPGFNPSVIENIPRVIDFDNISVLNAPWVTLSDYNTDMQVVRNDLSSLEADAVRSVEYTGTNKLVVKHFLYENPNAVVIWKADGLGDMTQNIFKKTGDEGDYWTYASFDAQHEMFAYFKITTDFTEITDDFILHTVNFTTMEDATLSTVYSSNPRFSEWVSTSPYEFTVFWNETTWMFNFNGTNVNGDSEEWTDPNATHLYVDYDGITLEASRERLDVGYILGDQTDKPLQKMGDYATIEDLDAYATTDSLSAYATVDSLSAYATTSDLTAKENISNKVTSIDSSSTDIQYPTAKCVYDGLELRELLANKVTSIDSASTDAQYPTAKCVYDIVGDLETIINAI